MFSSGANFIIWDEMLASGAMGFILDKMLSSVSFLLGYCHLYNNLSTICISTFIFF
jgi:hypothetical protein